MCSVFALLKRSFQRGAGGLEDAPAKKKIPLWFS
jgi:hypothetical protein